MTSAVGASVRVARVSLHDFRCFTTLDVEFSAGLTVLMGENGQGKTSLLEAVGWPARARSFRGVPDAALVRSGTEQAIVRCEVVSSALDQTTPNTERQQLFEAEIRAAGRNRILVNRQAITRTRDLAGFLRITTFAPDDLQLVKGPPAQRREYLDDLLLMLAPRYAAAIGDYERVVRQRNALLKSSDRDGPDHATLSVFDEQLVAAGAEIIRGRLRLIERIRAPLTGCYLALGEGEGVDGVYFAEWAGRHLDSGDIDELDAMLHAALAERRRNELARQVTLVGPHRDDVALRIAGLEARTHASQGEQRSLALALRLAGHDAVTAITEQTPVLLLDDVFSELDARRSAALVELLPAGQTLLSTAVPLPAGVRSDRTLRVAGARLVDA